VHSLEAPEERAGRGYASAIPAVIVMTPRDQLLQDLRDLDGFLLVVTGAGISLASGIPTFRGTDPGAVWKTDILEMATDHFFQREPVESWRWYGSRFDRVVQALPNPAHHALAELERWHGDRGVTDVYVLGLATDYCVKATVLDARQLGFTTHLIVDGCRGVNLQAGNDERAIDDMRAASTHVIQSAELLPLHAPDRTR
jgi:hypothetical protein